MTKRILSVAGFSPVLVVESVSWSWVMICLGLGGGQRLLNGYGMERENRFVDYYLGQYRR